MNNVSASSAQSHQHVRLGTIASTAIAGNDILSSCLYVCGIASLFAGVWAPLVFLVIGLVLYFYKHVYTEVVEALPLNGGAYNCLLNATTKNLAAAAGIMTILSYMATSVISAKTAVEYLHTIFHGLPVLPTTAVVIITFMALTIAGVKDSAKVAMSIFFFHLVSLLVFIGFGIYAMVQSGWGELPHNLMVTKDLFAHENGLKMLFFAFSASLLGVSGFESSANFVEEQKPGVFRKTLRNMLLGVVFFNPLIALVVLFSLPLPTVWAAKDFVLAESAQAIGGSFLQYLIVIDAFLVLSGAVLASFVGATGLLYRMTLDHCLPTTLFLPKLKHRNENANRLIIAFAVLCLSIMFLTGGHLLSLAGVYTISFLGVMTFFGIGNLLLRKNRPALKRTYQGPVIFVLLAVFGTLIGIVGNILIDSQNLVYFAYYFIPGFYIVICMIYRDYILEAILNLTKKVAWLHKLVEPWFEHVVSPRLVLFAHHPSKLFKSIDYIRRNETSRKIAVVFCGDKSLESKRFDVEFQQYIRFFKEAGIFPQLHIEYLKEKELEFGPEVIKAYANRFRITRNNVFIGSIHHTHGFSFEDLGGVRVIQ